MEGFDLTALDTIHATGGDALVHRVVTLFLTHAAQRMNDLAACAATGDLAAVAAAAVAVRSSAANIGAIRLHGLLTRLETEARAGDVARATPLLAEAAAAYADASARLRERYPEVRA